MTPDLDTATALGIADHGRFLRAASDEARRDFHIFADRYEDADVPHVFGIGEVETPVGTLLCEWRYRTVSRRGGSSVQARRDWWLNGERTTGGAFLRAMQSAA